MANANNRGWSFSAGERGRNRVRVYFDPSRGVIFAEYYERLAADGPARRARISLGHADRERAKTKAEELAVAFRTVDRPRREALTLSTLFDNYLREVTPAKSAGKQRHDVRAAGLFLTCFGRDRKVVTLSRREWDRFIAERRRGALRPHGVAEPRTVRDRQIAYDLRFLLACLNWATLAGDDAGGTLLERNPLKGLPLPREESPHRPMLSAEDYHKLLGVAGAIDRRFELALVLAHETGHRIGSIRMLRWSDVDLDHARCTWRATHDKIGFEHVTPLSTDAVAALARARALELAIGDAWIFPAPGNPAEPSSRHLFRDWWERGEAGAKLTPAPRRGWHSLRRRFATDLKDTPLKDLCELGGWKDPATVLSCYQRADEQTMRAALERRRQRAAEA